MDAFYPNCNATHCTFYVRPWRAAPPRPIDEWTLHQKLMVNIVLFLYVYLVRFEYFTPEGCLHQTITALIFLTFARGVALAKLYFSGSALDNEKTVKLLLTLAAFQYARSLLTKNFGGLAERGHEEVGAEKQDQDIGLGKQLVRRDSFFESEDGVPDGQENKKQQGDTPDRSRILLKSYARVQIINKAVYLVSVMLLIAFYGFS